MENEHGNGKLRSGKETMLGRGRGRRVTRLKLKEDFVNCLHYIPTGRTPEEI